MKNKLSKKTILIFVVLLAPSIAVFADKYPPDNAAVLYYKAFILYTPDDTMNNMLSDYIRGKIGLNEKIKEFLNTRQTRRIINTVMDASQIQNCNWGLNYSEGVEMEMPSLSSLRKLTYLILADAKMLAEQGDYKAALERCFTAKKMANHTGDGMLISFLVSISINALSNGAIQNILSSDTDISTLNWLKNQLQLIQANQPKAKDALINDSKCALAYKEQDFKDTPVESICDDPNDQKKLREILGNKELFEKNLEYYKRHLDLMIQSFTLPYPGGYEQLKKTEAMPSEDLKNNPDAFLAAMATPGVSKIYLMDLRNNAHNNALNCAVDIFIENSKNKKLLDSLPSDWPNDPFSQKPFIYEKTADGFLLKCNENNLPEEVKKDIDKYEYKFKLK
jgi:hypothetical protein